MRYMRTALLCAAFGLAITATGCGKKNAEPGLESSPNAAATVAPATAAPETAATASPTGTVQAEKEASILAYYADKEATKLIQKNVTIRYAAEEGKYLAALRSLNKSPSEEAVSLCPNMNFRSAKLAEGTVTVDLTLSDQDRLGSGGEVLLLDALKQTLFQFNEVQAIELLVDGKQTESLMGHMELMHPFKRSPQ